MPIYAYRCEQCDFQKDILQKMSDPLLVTCPSCHAPAFKKQVTAAGFQLKGSGWYVTDFRNPAAKAAPKKSSDEAAAPAPSETKPDSAASDSPAPSAAPAPAKSDAAPSKPAAGSGST